jgi:hypothetical protein
MSILFIYFMTNSKFNPTFADDGSMNENVYVCMYVWIHVNMQGYVFKNVYVGVLE